MMKNPEEFTNRLIGFKETVDNNLVNPNNVNIVKNNYLSDPDFDPEVI